VIYTVSVWGIWADCFVWNRAEFGAAAGVVGVGDWKRAIVVKHSTAPCCTVLCPVTKASWTGLLSLPCSPCYTSSSLHILFLQHVIHCSATVSTVLLHLALRFFYVASWTARFDTVMCILCIRHVEKPADKYSWRCLLLRLAMIVGSCCCCCYSLANFWSYINKMSRYLDREEKYGFWVIWWTDKMTNEEVLQSVDTRRNLLWVITTSHVQFLGHVMRKNQL